RVRGVPSAARRRAPPTVGSVRRMTVPKKDQELAEGLIAGTVPPGEAQAQLVAIARKQHGYRRVKDVLEIAAEGDARYNGTKGKGWSITALKLPPLTTMLMMLTASISAEAGRQQEKEDEAVKDEIRAAHAAGEDPSAIEMRG
ncbi:MAG: hypothetical protein ACR2NB_14650, partial [Solirubrobacteraceae bacterium]